METIVARRVRAWIETGRNRSRLGAWNVARRVRAWIETSKESPNLYLRFVARRVRAWIETGTHSITNNLDLSHAVCVRGLKQRIIDKKRKREKSHAVCVRGLKLE